jgi:hypothetical protein
VIAESVTLTSVTPSTIMAMVEPTIELTAIRLISNEGRCLIGAGLGRDIVDHL